MDKNKPKPRKRIHNPRTGKYYALRQRSSTKGRRGTIKGLWKPPTIKHERRQERATDSVFHFYKDVNQPLGVSAQNLGEFEEKLKSIDIESIEFHVERGDFESRIRFLGQPQLEQRVHRIKEEHHTGEDTIRSWHHQDRV